MTKQYDFKKEWEKTKTQLLEFSKQATVMAKKGEEELIRFSHQGKMHIDSTAASLKKEHLYHLIGKEYVKLKRPSVPTAKLKKLVEELKKVEKEQRAIKKTISSKAKKKRS